MSFEDKTFCTANCLRYSCHLNLTQEIEDLAEDAGLPVSMADRSEGCEDFIPMEEV